MRHLKHGKKFGRSSAHRQAMFKNQLRSLVEHERIKTTETKAKVLSRLMDKLITLSKKQSLDARRRAFRILRNDDLVAKLFGDLAPRFETRNGGYTRVVKIPVLLQNNRFRACRRGDGAKMSIIEFVERPSVVVEAAPAPASDSE